MRFGSMAGAAALALTLAGCVEPTSGGGYVVDGYDRNVLIVNQTGQTIYRFYGSNAGTRSWEEDILGSSVIPPGGSVMIDFFDGTTYCEYDFKIEFPDGSYITDYGVNVCAIGTYYVR